MNTIKFNEWNLDVERGLLTNKASDVEEKLPMKAVLVLCYFIDNAGRTVTKKELIEKIWNGHEIVGEQGVSNALWRIRKALGEDAKSPRYIETIPKVGYKWKLSNFNIPQVSEIEISWMERCKVNVTSWCVYGVLLLAFVIFTVDWLFPASDSIMERDVEKSVFLSTIDRSIPSQNSSSLDVEGLWRSVVYDSYQVSLTKINDGYHYEGTNGAFFHKGVIKQNKMTGEFEGALGGVEGKCCGRQGYVWLRWDGKGLMIRSEWESRLTSRSSTYAFGWSNLIKVKS